MWMSLAMLAALAAVPGENNSLTLTNVRTTYGVLGAPRPDNKILPGDILTVSFDLEGCQVNESGKILYSIGMEVSDKNGKVHFKQEPRNLEAHNSLGGTTHPAFATLQVGLDEPPGEYTVKVTVTDRAAGATQTFTQTYEVLAKAFGIVRFSTSSDPSGVAPAAALAAGQTVWINFGAVGFARNEGTGQPDLAAALRVLDADGKPVTAKPLVGEVKEGVPPKAQGVPMQFVLELNRPGNFTLELKVTDRIAGKSATLSYPLTVAKTK
jgi:hypothetical protein